MNPQVPAAGENIRHLRQGLRLIRRLSDEQYTHCPPGPFRGGVGSQFRHCIDFYDTFLRGVEGGRIDYGGRERDARTETDRGHAVGRIERLIDALAALGPADLGREVRVRSEDRADSPAADDEAGCWSRSTVHRELLFLASHTVHHHALIVSLLLAQGVVPGDELEGFGVAPSTLSHWKKAESGAA